MNLIKINDDFSFGRDFHCWRLVDTRKKIAKTSYFANLSQISHAIVDRSTGDCKNLAEITSLLINAESIVTDALKALSEGKSK